jgi:hypothetical protein
MRSLLADNYFDQITPQYLVGNGWTYNPTTQTFNKCIFNDQYNYKFHDAYATMYFKLMFDTVSNDIETYERERFLTSRCSNEWKLFLIGANGIGFGNGYCQPMGIIEDIGELETKVVEMADQVLNNGNIQACFSKNAYINPEFSKFLKGN